MTFRFARSKVGISGLIVLQFMSVPCWAAGDMNGSLLTTDLSSAGAGSEYVSGNYPGAILMPVSLWGAINRPGIHHIPTHTDLVHLLSLAGGPTADAELNHITVKRRSEKDEEIIRVDAEEILTKPGVHSPVLQANDIILIPREKPTVSQNTMTTVTFLSAIATLVLAGVALANIKR